VVYRDPRRDRISLLAITDSEPGVPIDLAITGEQLGIGFHSNDLSILATASGYLAAWSEEVYDDTGGEVTGYSIVRVLPIDASGSPIGSPALLSAPEDDVSIVEPRLARFGDTIALTWARGTIIYQCGGCMPDHRLELVLLDPDSLAPRSEVLTNLGQGAPSGLGHYDLVTSGAELMTAFQIEYHVSADPGTLSLRCGALP
jgi:hypothetical protein